MSAMMSAESPSTREFEIRVREHQAGLRAFIRALGVDDVWVDDLAQETLLTAYRRLDVFEPGTDFGKWLRSIARNLAANERRKEARHSRLLPLAIADLLLDEGMEDDFFGADLTRLLPFMRECIEQLPQQNQMLLRRRYGGGEKATDLARELGVKGDLVRQSLLRIRVAVKECIEKKTEGVWF